MEPRCEGGAEVCGVHSLDREFVESLRELLYGKNRSRVNSSNSEPINPIASEYLSRRNRDSETMNSANNLTRSPSVAAAASFRANVS